MNVMNVAKAISLEGFIVIYNSWITTTFGGDDKPSV